MFCTKKIDEEFSNFYHRILRGQQDQKSTEKRAINIVNTVGGELLGKLFVSKFFPLKDKLNIHTMIDDTLNIMKQSLLENNWLTNFTKKHALDKLSKFNKKIGYPDIWKDYSKYNIDLGDPLYIIFKKYNKWSIQVNFFDKLNSILDTTEWKMTPQTVNAYFNPTCNEIVFPAAILQPPFYNSLETIDFDITDEINMAGQFDILTPANYGAILAVIAHEITHGYDDQGCKIDKNGNLNEWWSNKDKELFKEKTNIMELYSKKYTYIDMDTDKTYSLNAQLTMGENLADLGGLALSIKGLLTKLHNKEPNIVKASLRVFFKSWANIWKQNIKKERRLMLLNCDPHSPCEFRGNLVNHIDEFYYAFDIKKTDNMYIDPVDRLKMW